MRSQESFTYGPNKYIHLMLVIFFLCIVGWITTNGIYRPGELAYVAIFIPIVILGAFLSMLVWLDIVVTPEGIRKPFYILPGWFIKWDEIASVRLAPGNRNGWSCLVLPRSGFIWKSIMLRSSIRNADRLVDLVNAELIRRCIPVQQWQGSELVNIYRLPSAK